MSRLALPLVLSVAAMLQACLSMPTASRGYDPNARETLGTIHAKVIAAENAKQEVTMMLRTQQVGTAGPPVTVYRHTVMLEDGRSVEVMSSYPGHTVGDCVKVFESSQPSYPRLANHSGCKR